MKQSYGYLIQLVLFNRDAGVSIKELAEVEGISYDRMRNLLDRTKRYLVRIGVDVKKDSAEEIYVKHYDYKEHHENILKKRDADEQSREEYLKSLQKGYTLDNKIEDLYDAGIIVTRVKNCLVREYGSDVTLRDIDLKSDEELLSIYGIGYGSLKHIYEVINKSGRGV